MSEFTGERVIPGQVNDDLWAEHVARYHFAARFPSQKLALDIGCGSGYGTSLLARDGTMAGGIDICLEPLVYARERDQRPFLVQASAIALPFRDASFDLITAFEVIEHLHEWRALLSEARRLLDPQGVFLISTPNKTYYADARAENGPNPFHIHEFEFREFSDTLAEFFPRTTIFLQNWTEAISFTPCAGNSSTPAALTESSAGSPVDAHFFLAVCSFDATPDLAPFVFVPSAANLLREREQHIHLLQHELEQNREWLAAVTSDRNRLIDIHEEQKRQLEEHNRWALQLEDDWKAAIARVAQLQDEFRNLQDRATAKLADLEQENQTKTEWALETERSLTAAIAAKCDELAATVRLLDQAESTVIERTQWAQGLQQRVEFLESQLAMIRDSRWVKLGRTIGVGPKVQR